MPMQGAEYASSARLLRSAFETPRALTSVGKPIDFKWAKPESTKSPSNEHQVEPVANVQRSGLTPDAPAKGETMIPKAHTATSAYGLR